MSTNTIQTGGLLGDPTETLNPPAPASACCGSPATAALKEPAQVSTCCGTVAEAKAEASCCGSAAKEQAVASGAACCG